MGGICFKGSQFSKVQSVEAVQSKAIDDENRQHFLKDQKMKKILLLGAGESGKSTLYRQMKRIYGVGFTEEEIEDFRIVIASNTILMMQTLLDAADKFAGEFSPAIDESMKPHIEAVRGVVAACECFTPEIANHIKTLWSDAGLQSVFEIRSKFQMIDSASHFFAKADELAAPDYTPSDQVCYIFMTHRVHDSHDQNHYGHNHGSLLVQSLLYDHQIQSTSLLS